MTLKVQSVAIGSVAIDPANLRRHPTRNLDAIAASLRRFGQRKPIVVDADGIVRAGNGTLEAARALGWTQIDVVRTTLKGADAVAYAIADNRTGELAEWDEAGLAETLRALQAEAFDLAAVGYSEAEVEALIDGLTDGVVVEDPAGEWRGVPACENGVNPIHRTLKIFFRSDEDVAAFARLIDQPIADETADLWYPRHVMQHPSRDPYVDADAT
jgi:hypothetical protein